MNKSQFLQEKSAFLIRFPDQDEFSFYRYLSEQRPDEAAGWLHLGREWEKRGKSAAALEAYRRALHAKEQDHYFEEARIAYHNLLRQRKRQRFLRGLRRAASLLLFFSAFFLPETSAPPPDLAASTASVEKMQRTPFFQSHTELVAVPPDLRGRELERRVSQYLKTRQHAAPYPFTVIIVPQTAGMPSFTPLPFYKPGKVMGVVVYDPRKQATVTRQFFPQACACDDQEPVQLAKQAFALEQQALEQALMLRNALYRTYQRTGKLPERLEELAKGHPDNVLPALPKQRIPAHAALADSADKGGVQEWTYVPHAFDPREPWQSLRAVVPLTFYPEPSPALGPLELAANKATFSMRVISGPYLVRQYPIGIGKNNSTPEGRFAIREKINQPNGKRNIYGTRGMVFKDAAYAIHGTNDPGSIGQARSLGCIRLHNRDVEELYTFAAIGTPVTITGKPANRVRWSNPDPATIAAGAGEQTPGVVYHWLN